MYGHIHSQGDVNEDSKSLVKSQLRSEAQWGRVKQGEGIWLCGARGDLLNGARSEWRLCKASDSIIVSK